MSGRRFQTRVGIACIVATAFTAISASASETSTYRWVLEDYAQPHGIGGANFFLLVGPLGGTIVNTRITAKFVTADAWDVSNLHIQMFGPIVQPDETVGAELDLFGTDFGWSGVGHFQVVYDTDDLNGEIHAPGGVSLWSLDLNEFGNFYFGRYLTLHIELEIEDIVSEGYCAGDLNGDGEINGTDLRDFTEGPCPTNGDPCLADVDGDGIVTRDDRDLLITFFENVCPYAP